LGKETLDKLNIYINLFNISSNFRAFRKDYFSLVPQKGDITSILRVCPHTVVVSTQASTDCAVYRDENTKEWMFYTKRRGVAQISL
jgi:hypothetical protein